jgi:hypothetical protein
MSRRRSTHRLLAVVLALAASSFAATPATASSGLTPDGGSEGSCVGAGPPEGTFRVQFWFHGGTPVLLTEARGITLPDAYFLNVEPRKVARLDVSNGCSESLLLILVDQERGELLGVALPGTNVSLGREQLDALGLGGLQLVGFGDTCCYRYPDELSGMPISFVLGP